MASEPNPPSGTGGTGLSRRSFLTLGGGALAMTAVTACQPRLPVLLPPPTTGRDLQVGLLVPAHSVHPNLAVELQAALVAGLAAAGVDAAITAVAVGHGLVAASDAFDARVAAGDAVVVGVVSNRVAGDLADGAASARVPLLVASPGANALDPTGTSPYVAHNTLNLWQANSALGAWAAGHVGPRALVASSTFDAGFDSVFAFEAAFVAAGGSVVGRSLTHGPGRATNGVEGLAAAIRASGASFVFGQYSGPRAADFVSAATAAGVPILTSAFAAVHAAAALGRAADGIITAVTWPAPTTGAFEAVGRDSATLIAGTANLGAGLRVFAFDGARGACAADAATNAVLGPIHRAVVSGGAITLAESLGGSAGVHTVPAGPSGFVEEYLCG